MTILGIMKHMAIIGIAGIVGAVLAFAASEIKQPPIHAENTPVVCEDMFK